MSFSEKNTHTLTNTDTMSPFLIFFIVVTIGYVLYYAAIITMDMNAKPKDAVTQGETMEAPDGIETTEDYNGEDIDEETASREADEENNDDYPEGHSEDETDDDQQGEYNNQGAYMNVDESPTEPESQTSDTEPEDDDIYGIDNQMNEESEKQETEPYPSSEEAFPSNQEETSEQTPEDSPETEAEPSDSDEDDEEDIEALKEQMRRHLAEVAQAEGAQMVEAEVPDKNEFAEEHDDGFRGMVDAHNYDTGLAHEINQNNESIETESTTPVRQDIFASTIMGAWGGLKKQKQSEEQEEDM